jgi:hypothetical protein
MNCYIPHRCDNPGLELESVGIERNRGEISRLYEIAKLRLEVLNFWYSFSKPKTTRYDCGSPDVGGKVTIDRKLPVFNFPKS